VDTLLLGTGHLTVMDRKFEVPALCQLFLGR
jgi:hypothetical protein